MHAGKGSYYSVKSILSGKSEADFEKVSSAFHPSKYGGQSTTYFQECCNFNIFRKKDSPALVRTRQSRYSYYNRFKSVVSNYSTHVFPLGARPGDSHEYKKNATDRRP
jgi:hypothetical protein